jgi:hypothetical protein
MLFWKEDIDAESCKVCGMSRWKEDKRTGTTIFVDGNEAGQNVT